MKKAIILFLLLAMALSLTACAGLAQKAVDEESATPVPTPTEDPTAVQQASETNAQTAVTTHTPAASATDAQVDQAAYDRAVACIGMTLQDLYAAVGEPVEPATYGPSCLQDGAEDGMLIYNGFFVWTLRTAEAETVQEVYLDE